MSDDGLITLLAIRQHSLTIHRDTLNQYMTIKHYRTEQYKEPSFLRQYSDERGPLIPIRVIV